MKLIKNIGPLNIRAYAGKQFRDPDHLHKAHWRGYCYGSDYPRFSVQVFRTEITQSLVFLMYHLSITFALRSA